MSLLDSAAVTFQCVLTKADKVKEGSVRKSWIRCAQRWPNTPPPIPKLS